MEKKISHMLWNGSFKPNLSKYPLSSVEFQAVLNRMMKISECTDIRELESFLGLTYGEIDEAKYRNMVPAYFLLIMMQKAKASPTWILTGDGTPYLSGAKKQDTLEMKNTLQSLLNEIHIIMLLADENKRVRKRILYLYGKDSRFLA